MPTDNSVCACSNHQDLFVRGWAPKLSKHATSFVGNRQTTVQKAEQRSLEVNMPNTVGGLDAYKASSSDKVLMSARCDIHHTIHQQLYMPLLRVTLKSFPYDMDERPGEVRKKTFQRL